MSIHFDFVVDEQDAENIFEAISEQIRVLQVQKIEYSHLPNLLSFLDRRILYYKDLKTKMKNRKQE